MKHYILGFLILVGVGTSTKVFACFKPPAYLYSSINDLISRSPRIFLGRIIEELKEVGDYPILVDIPDQAKSLLKLINESNYRAIGLRPFLFEIEDDLKGGGPSRGIVFGYSATKIKNLKDIKWLSSDFNNHTLDEFWNNSYGRTSQASDCLAHPFYFPQSTYLIFSTSKQHLKGYEKISSKQDQWLNYIKMQMGKE